MEKQIQKLKRNNKIRILIIIAVITLLVISVSKFTQNHEYTTTLGLSIVLFLLSTPLIYITAMAYIKIAKLNKSLNQKNREIQRQKEEIENKAKETCKYCGCKTKEDLCQNCGAKRTE